MDPLDQKLLEMLLKNAREPITSLSHALNVSRATITERMKKLEARGIIAGYTLRLSEATLQRNIAAHVMIAVEPRSTDAVLAALKNLASIHSLHAVSGIYDLIAVLRSDNTQGLDRDLDIIRNIKGVVKTVSSIVLSTKLGN
ncbi:MAG: Lrp/AsnC family transcriptional regulator [Rhodobacteraceae bacterium]|nr:Lrp/AsnC family transcriptional regulator [Paracoccaceae bacterium]